MFDTPALALSDVPVPSPDGQRTVSLAVRAGHIGCLVEQDIAGLVCLSYLAGLRIPAEGEVSVSGHRPNPILSKAMLIRGGRRLCPSLTIGEHLTLVERCHVDDILDDFGLAPLKDLSDLPITSLPIQLCQELEVALAILSGAGSLLLHRPFESLLGYERRRLLTLLRTFVGKGGACLYTTRYRRLAKFAETVFLGSFTPGEQSDEGKTEANAMLSDFDHPAQPCKGRIVGLLARTIDSMAQVQSWFEERTTERGRGEDVLFHPKGNFGGLLPNLTLAEHACYLFGSSSLCSWGHVRQRAASNCVEELLQTFAFPAIEPNHYPEEIPRTLRPRLSLALQLARVPTTIFAFHPCQGVNSVLPNSEQEKIVHMLKEFAASGGAVVLCSNDLELLSMLCTEVRCAQGDVEGRQVMVRGVFQRMLS